jgi:hypothetical protein
MNAIINEINFDPMFLICRQKLIIKTNYKNSY